MFIHKFIIMQAIGCHVHGLFIIIQVAKKSVIPKVTTLVVAKTITFSSIHAHTPKWI